MLDHLFIASDGDLFDTRDPNWSHKPLRPRYKYIYSDIKTVAQFKATLRAGAYAWPGGYPMYLLTSDGAALCFDCARKEARNIIDDIQDDIRRHGRGNYQWRVCGCDINYEDAYLHCEHCGEHIESAYGEDLI